MSARRQFKAPAFTKVTDVEFHFRCASGNEAIYREEVFVDLEGKVVRYNLALIHHTLFGKDNGRVLGYDNAHGVHERHWMGRAEIVVFTSYEETLARFIEEVRWYRETA